MLRAGRALTPGVIIRHHRLSITALLVHFHIHIHIYDYVYALLYYTHTLITHNPEVGLLILVYLHIMQVTLLRISKLHRLFRLDIHQHQISLPTSGATVCTRLVVGCGWGRRIWGAGLMPAA